MAAVLACLALVGTVAVCDDAIPEGFELAFSDDFEAGSDAWQVRETNVWEVVELGDGNHVYQLSEKGIQGEIRAPGGMAILKDQPVGDLILTARVKCLTPTSVRGRDINIFLGYQDPTHFYYVHFSNATDEIHNAICVVNGEPRKPITAETATHARLDSDGFHDIMVVRRGGRIEAFIDEMDEPVMYAEDTTLSAGLVGLGSFDDTAQFDDVRLYVPAE